MKYLPFKSFGYPVLTPYAGDEDADADEEDEEADDDDEEDVEDASLLEVEDEDEDEDEEDDDEESDDEEDASLLEVGDELQRGFQCGHMHAGKAGKHSTNGPLTFWTRMKALLFSIGQALAIIFSSIL